jgi:hypothetical protein
MLGERETRREIHRQFLVEDRDFMRIFHALDSRSPSDRHSHATVFLVAATFLVLTMVGPDIMTEEEVAVRRRPPAARRSWPPRIPFDGMTGLALANPLDIDAFPTCGPALRPPSPSWDKPSAAA